MVNDYLAYISCTVLFSGLSEKGRDDPAELDRTPAPPVLQLPSQEERHVHIFVGLPEGDFSTRTLHVAWDSQISIHLNEILHRELTMQYIQAIFHYLQWFTSSL